MSNEKRCEFYGKLYVGDRAEMKATSVRLPAGLLDDLDVICEWHESEYSREYARLTGKEVKPMSRSEFISAAIVNQMARTLHEDDGGLVLKVKNPQRVKEPTEETRAEIMKILAEVAALQIDKRAGFKTGINELIKYHFEKLCAENTGDEFTGEYIYDCEIAEMQEKARGEK